MSVIRLPLLIAALVATATPAAAQFTMAAPTQASNQNCDFGPLNKEFGGQYWSVFGCEDGKTLIFVAGAGNRATPYVFTSTPGEAGGAPSPPTSSAVRRGSVCRIRRTRAAV